MACKADHRKDGCEIGYIRDVNGCEPCYSDGTAQDAAEIAEGGKKKNSWLKGLLTPETVGGIIGLIGGGISSGGQTVAVKDGSAVHYPPYAQEQEPKSKNLIWIAVAVAVVAIVVVVFKSKTK